jgi:hypothetical protein
LCLAATIAVHVGAAATFIGMRLKSHVAKESNPIIATMIDAPQTEAEAPPEYTPPQVNVVYALQPPPDLAFENDAITPPEVTTAAIDTPQAQTAAPPMVGIEYARTRATVSARVTARSRARNSIAARSRGRARPPRADPDRTIERLLPPRLRRASRGGEGVVPSARSERHRPACASTHPDRVRPPLDLIYLARR